MSVLGLGVLGGLGVCGARPAAAQSSPDILLLDMGRIRTQSLVAISVEQQVRARVDRIQGEVTSSREDLQREIADFQARAAELAAEEAVAQETDLRARTSALQESLSVRMRSVQDAAADANNAVDAVLGPILDAIRAERRASVILDSRGVLSSNTTQDITDEAMERLNKTLPEIKLSP